MKLLKCSAGGNKDQGTDVEELDEDEMLRRAIAMSLQEEEVEVKGELKKSSLSKNKNNNVQLFS